MLNILLVTEGTRFAGIEAHLSQLILSFREAGNIQVQLALFDDGPLAKAARNQGLTVHLLHRKSKYDTRIIDDMVTIIERSGAQVVHTHGYLANVVAALAGKRRSTPLVTTVHGAPERYTGFAGLKMRRNIWLDRRAMRRRCDRVITVASFLRDQLIKHRVAAEKIIVVPNGIADREPDPSQRYDNRRELELPPDAPAIAFAGRLENVKNPLAFVNFAQMLQEQLPQARFLVAGDGPLAERMRKRVLALDLFPDFRFLGHLPDIEPMLAASDLLVMTSRSEGVPLAALEAMRAARPVVALGVGGIPETLAPFPQAVAPPGDVKKLAELAAALLQNREALNNLGRGMRQHFLANYRADSMARATIAVYRQVVKQ